MIIFGVRDTFNPSFALHKPAFRKPIQQQAFDVFFNVTQQHLFSKMYKYEKSKTGKQKTKNTSKRTNAMYINMSTKRTTDVYK